MTCWRRRRASAAHHSSAGASTSRRLTQRGRLVFQREDRLLDLPLPSLIGPHQIVNAGTAVAAALELGIDERAIAAGLTAARWPARMQRLGSGTLTRDIGRTASCGSTAGTTRRPARSSPARWPISRSVRRARWCSLSA